MEDYGIEFNDEDYKRVRSLITKEKILQATAAMASRGEVEVMKYLKSKGVTGEKALRSWDLIKQAALVWGEKNK